MQPSECFAVFFAASLSIDTPRLTVIVVVHIHRPAAAGVQGPPMLRDADVVPLGDLSPRLGAKLLGCVGRHDALAEWAGVHDPSDQPRSQRGLADAVAAGRTELNWIDCSMAVKASIADLLTDLFHEANCPVVGA